MEIDDHFTMVKTDGPRSFYKHILDANKKADESESIISLNDVGVADTSIPLISLLRIAISTEEELVEFGSRKTL